MNASFDQCSLYLCPEQHNFTPEDNFSLITALQKIDFIANKIDIQEAGNCYFTGKKFLDYIAYMGCAPAIQFEASEDNDSFCFIKIQSFESAQLIYSRKQLKAPHCPGCKKPVKSWQETSKKPMTPAQIFCEHCNTYSNTGDFNWRKMAGFAQLFIEITDIFPKEAIPQQLLLDKLASITNVEWLYFYSCK